MAASRYRFEISWTKRGLFVMPALPVSVFEASPETVAHDPWLTLVYAVSHAQRGDFSHMRRLLDLYWRSQDAGIKSLAISFVGWAGPEDLYDEILAKIDPASHVTQLNGIFRPVTMRRLLADVPLLLDVFENDPPHDDNTPLIYYFSYLLGISSVIDPWDLAEVVEARFEELRNQFKTDRVHLFRGEIYNVRRLAEFILGKAREGHLLQAYRAEFEAATGIDCSTFYKDRKKQPLAAAALLEEFLENTPAERFQDGQRYFFGHPIPMT